MNALDKLASRMTFGVELPLDNDWSAGGRQKAAADGRPFGVPDVGRMTGRVLLAESLGFEAAWVRDVPVHDLELLLALNAVAPYRLVQAHLPQLVAARGTVVQTSTLAAAVPLPFYGVYAAAFASIAEGAVSTCDRASIMEARVSRAVGGVQAQRAAGNPTGRTNAAGRFRRTEQQGEDTLAWGPVPWTY